MEHSESTLGSEAFGSYLKKVREGRRLSLDAVEELSSGFPEKLTKSHLSRIENGLALPSFPRLMALSHIYGMPIGSFAERFEVELRRGMTPLDLGERTDEDVLAEAEGHAYRGDFNEALLCIWALLDRHDKHAAREDAANQLRTILDLRLRAAMCLVKLGRHEYAKMLCEDVLAANEIPEPLRLKALFVFASASHRLQHYTVALLALDECDRCADGLPPADRLRADVLCLRGVIQETTGRHVDALHTYERARTAYEAIGQDYEQLNMEIGIGSALVECGRLAEGRGVLEAVLGRIEHGHHERPKAVALSNLAQLSFREKKLDEAEGLAIKSNLIARPREYHPVVFRNCFYLWRIAQERGDAAATRLNERTLTSLLGKIEEAMPEADEFRSVISRREA